MNERKKNLIKHLIEQEDITIEDFISVVIELNAIIGVGLITLGDILQHYCYRYGDNESLTKEELIDLKYRYLRTQFFKECVTEIPGYNRCKKVNLPPHDLFEWFKKNTTLEKFQQNAKN